MSGGFDDPEARAAWDRGADAWLEFVRSGADYYRTRVHGPALLDACAAKPGDRALDAGCGEGYLARQLAGSGARVTGIDLSPRLLEYARAEEERDPSGVEYLEGSAAELDGHFGPGEFDLIASCMAVQDMSDPASFFRSAATVLAPDGRVVVSVPHPSSDTAVRAWERDDDGRKLFLKVDRYFDTGPAECVWNMERLVYPWTTPYWRRTLEEWSSMTAAAGFVIERLGEPRPTSEDVARWPELDDCARVPYFLILTLRL